MMRWIGSRSIARLAVSLTHDVVTIGDASGLCPIMSLATRSGIVNDQAWRARQLRARLGGWHRTAFWRKRFDAYGDGVGLQWLRIG